MAKSKSATKKNTKIEELTEKEAAAQRAKWAESQRKRREIKKEEEARHDKVKQSKRKWFHKNQDEKRIEIFEKYMKECYGK